MRHCGALIFETPEIKRNINNLTNGALISIQNYLMIVYGSNTGSPSVDLSLCCMFFSLFILVFLYCLLIEF